MNRSTWKTAAAACAVSAGLIIATGCGDSAKQAAGNLGSTVAEGWNRFGTDPNSTAQQQQQAQAAGGAPVPQQTQAIDPSQFKEAKLNTTALDQQLAQIIQPQQQQPAAQQAAAQQTNGRGAVTTLGQDRYRAACNDFVAVAAEQQKTDVWCWAACVQMVNKFNGVETTQADIAGRIHGQATDANGNIDPEKVKRAGTTEIMLALNPEFQKNLNQDTVNGITNAIHSHGKVNLSYDAKSTAMALVREKTYGDNDMIADVARGMPVVVGLKDPTGNTGHAYVVYGTTYKATKGVLPGSYTYALESVEAVDPWDGKAVSITANEFTQRCGFKISQARAKEVLERHRNAVQVK